MAAILFVVATLGTTIAAPVTPLEAEILAANGNATILETQLAPVWATTSPIRSTASLLWTSIFTLFIALYSVIHLSLPPGSSPGEYIRAKTLIAARTVFLPEITLALAIVELFWARFLKRELQPFAKQHEGGFGLPYCFYAVMGGFARKDNKAVIKPAALIYLAKEKGRLIPQAEDDIKARSHADGLARALICVQVGWMVIQCIGRKAMNLPVSLLEIYVLAYVVFALALYGLWFYKPLDITLPTEVDPALLHDVPAEFFAKDSSEEGFHYLDLVGISEIAWGEADSFTYTALATLGYVAYCSIYLAAWRYHFPTETEMWLWHVSSLAVISLYPLAATIYLITSYIAPGWEGLVFHLTVPLAMNLCVISHFLLLVEAVSSVREMPIGVYVTIGWSNYIPHL